MNKSDELLNDSLNFMNSLKKLLKQFDIETTNVWIMNSNKRKRDEKLTKTLKFGIKANSVDNFINKIGWYK